MTTPTTPARDWALKAADAVLGDLMDRRGIKQALCDVDGDVFEEIRATLAQIIRSVVASSMPGDTHAE